MHSTSLTPLQSEARRQAEICNACRYCEGLCAVFPALQRRTNFLGADIDQLANLCHNCRGCHYACQYIEPHPFAINIPRILSEARAESYARYAWPKPLARLFERNGTILALLSALGMSLALVAVTLITQPDMLFAIQTGPGSFYRVISWEVMAGLSGATFGYALLALGIGGWRFWRSTEQTSTPGKGVSGPLLHAAGDVLSLRNLGGAGHGCNDRNGAFSNLRRRLHHALFYGFLLCFSSTSVAWFYDHFLGLPAPYDFLSLPVLLGSAGGLGMVVGASGLLWLKLIADQAPGAPSLLGADAALLILLILVALTGLILLALRSTAAMSLLLAGHLGLVLSLFVMLPYSKMVHGVYRSLALLRDRRERSRIQ